MTPTVSQEPGETSGASESHSVPPVRPQNSGPHRGFKRPYTANPAEPDTVETEDNGPSYRNTLSILRPSRGNVPVQDTPDSQRQIQLTDRNFPKRAKAQSSVPVPQESSIGKLIVGIWEQIHGGINLEPRSLVEQWRMTAALTTTSLDGAATLGGDGHEGSLAPPTPPPSASHSPPGLMTDGNSAFSESSAFCRKVTQASRTCRSVEVIVQARWTEHFDAYAAHLALSHPEMSPTRCRRAALSRACADFGWSEKELRNKMAVWRGYREIREVGGWAALVFAGMGIYRLCKYRVGFGEEGMARLRACRERFEVAADTLHPRWRQLLAIVGVEDGQRFGGHPHDWVVHADGAVPTPLAATYLDLDPYFRFEHLDESVIDVEAWGGDDPRWVPPPRAASANVDTCAACGMRQDDDLKLNSCYCFPSLFPGPKSNPPIQVFHTANGKRNGVQALTPFQRGAAVGEFVGLVTRGIEDLDVMVGEAGGVEYQIWQGRQGNFTRFINHSCKANAQFQPFVWRGAQRVVLVSKGIEAGREVTVDYSGSYWRGLDKRCLCGEACCRYTRR